MTAEMPLLRAALRCSGRQNQRIHVTLAGAHSCCPVLIQCGMYVRQWVRCIAKPRRINVPLAYASAMQQCKTLLSFRQLHGDTFISMCLHGADPSAYLASHTCTDGYT